MSEHARTNLLDPALMVASAGVAYFAPFHTFLLAYAVLGPLHYLTEISWLHDRRYFSSSRGAGLVLGGLAVVGAAQLVGLAGWHPRIDPLLVAFCVAVPLAFVRRGRAMVVWCLLAAGVAAVLGAHPGPIVFALVFLPTLVHVFVFTWLFVLHGALRQRSRSGLVSVLLLSALAIVLLGTPGPAGPLSLSSYVSDNMRAFGGLHLALADLLGWPPSAEFAVRAMRFVAFAYTYHYLNWFSKTDIIGWGRIRRERAVFIGGCFVASVALYAYDYVLGLQVLFALSLAHVLLELPLDWRTLRGVAAEIRGWRGGRESQAGHRRITTEPHGTAYPSQIKAESARF